MHLIQAIFASLTGIGPWVNKMAFTSASGNIFFLFVAFQNRCFHKNSLQFFPLIT